MSASMTAPERIDSFDKLLAILSADKADIAARGVEERKQYQMTAELKAQFDEAKSAVAKHAAKETELTQREEALAKIQATHADEHAQKMEELNKHVASENTRLETFAAQLDRRKAEQDEIATKQAAESARLASIQFTHAQEHQAAMGVAATLKAEAAAQVTTNAAEAQRLKEWDAALKAKAARLREQIANF